MLDVTKFQLLEAKYRSLVTLIDERMRRRWAATDARAYGRGGVRAVSSVVGMSPNTTLLAMELAQQGHAVCLSTAEPLLNKDGYSLKSNRKTKEGEDYPHRNAQFGHINAIARRFHRRA